MAACLDSLTFSCWGVDLKIDCASVSEHLRACATDSVEYQSGRDITGTRVYPGARVLCALLGHLAHGPKNELKASRFLELGAGCGLAGIYAAHHTQQQVVFTDREELVLARHNVAKASHISASCQFEQLEWSSANVQTLLANYPEGFDWIIGTELVYFSTDPSLLIATVRDLLAVRTASDDQFPVAILSHVNRLNDPSRLTAVIEQFGLAALPLPIEEFLTEDLSSDPAVHSVEVVCLALASIEQLVRRFQPYFRQTLDTVQPLPEVVNPFFLVDLDE